MLDLAQVKSRKGNMTNPSKAKLQERIDELESENQDLRDKLDAIADVVNGEEDEDEEEDEDD